MPEHRQQIMAIMPGNRDTQSVRRLTCGLLAQAPLGGNDGERLLEGATADGCVL